MGDGLNLFFNIVTWLLLPLAILGVWKLIEILIWLFNHIAIRVI